MGYCLNAILGKRTRLQAEASVMPSAVFVPLTDDLGLIPLSEELLDAVNKGGTESHEKGEPNFTYLTAHVASWLKSLSAGTTVAYVEAEYFGGTGDQCAIAWQNGTEVISPTKAQDAINQALILLGVIAEEGKDEFDTVWLGRHRTMEGWVDEGAARKRMTTEPKSDLTYPPFGEVVESFRRFLRDQGFSDTIRWVWRENICSRRAPGSQRSCNRTVYVNLSSPKFRYV